MTSQSDCSIGLPNDYIGCRQVLTPSKVYIQPENPKKREKAPEGALSR